ncbi:MAG TPA: hypothetical protein DEA96_15735 [Leptospiraceae bacterium]|nr:hypothetical protein [Leptospiraceae bacterium]|tara:strand:+ start:9815 stop:10531 length:717 start_codon:yes stop_codon:yes gene_type:complete
MALGFSLASCQTIIFASNPAAETRGFLESIQNQDTQSLKELVRTRSRKLQTFVMTLENLRQSDSPAARAIVRKLNSLKIDECFAGPETGICYLNDGSQVILVRDGLGWQIDLDKSALLQDHSRISQILEQSTWTPREVTIRFSRALLQKDVKEAQSLSTEDTAKIVPLLVERIAEKFPDPSDEEMAEVEAELQTMKCEIYLQQASCAPEKSSKFLPLVQIDGVWRVELRKGPNQQEIR